MLAFVEAGMVFTDLRCDDDNRWRDADDTVGAVAFDSLLPDCGCFAFTVELEEEVEDSRTGGNALFNASFVLAVAELITGLGRSGRLVEYFASVAEVVMIPLEYDEAELGVGTWLYGESVYLDEGVAEWESPGTGGVTSRMEYALCVSSDGRTPAGAADLRYESLYSFLPVGGNVMPSTASSNASL